MGLKEYTGMPIFGEVGPLTIDSDVEKIVYENCEKKYAKFSMKIEMMTLIPNNYCFPIEALIEINGNNLIVFSQENEQKHELIHGQIGSGVYPNVHLLKKANNIFEINFSENEKIRFLTNSNRDRDIVALSIRLISGKNLNENENIHTIEEVKLVLSNNLFNFKII